MKLSKELKAKIDNYFESITADVLYEIAVTKYSFKQEKLTIVNNKFIVGNMARYESNNSKIEFKKIDHIQLITLAA